MARAGADGCERRAIRTRPRASLSLARARRSALSRCLRRASSARRRAHARRVASAAGAVHLWEDGAVAAHVDHARLEGA
eukprot:1844422-Prymnesium_polylepis.2